MYLSPHVFWKWLLSLALVLACLAASALPVFADIAPPPNTPGTGIVPDGPQTRVRMMYENVFADITPGGTARFDINFVMLNLGDKEEKREISSRGLDIEALRKL